MTRLFSILLAAFLWLSTPIFVIGGKERDPAEIVFKWRQLEFGFPSDNDRQEAIEKGNLVPANGSPIDVQTTTDDSRVFITIPRFQTGIPYTLATVSGESTDNGPVLQPYPSYDWHSSHGTNCDHITSAFRVAINECRQMWVIDSGVIGSTYHCAPQLLLFDLNTNQLLHRYRFNNDIFIPIASVFIVPVINTLDPAPTGRCEQTMVYIADVSFHGIVIYDQKRNTAWRAENKFMYPDPDYGTHTIANESFTLMDGIFGMSTDKKNLYFHPLASHSEFAVPLSVLNNQNNWNNGVEAMIEEFTRLGSRGKECAAEATDSLGNNYCVTLDPIRLLSWNVNTPYNKKNQRSIPINPRAVEFVSGMKVIRNSAGQEELWMMSNRYQKIALGTLRSNEVNFRVVKRTLADVQNDLGDSGKNKDLHNQLVFN